MFQFSLSLFCASLVAATQIKDEFASFKTLFNKKYDETEEVSKHTWAHLFSYKIKNKTPNHIWHLLFIKINIWIHFSKIFSKQYAILIFKVYRINVFKSNLRIINEHNKGYKEGRYSWSMGVNQFTDLTPAEFMALNNLQIPDAPKRELTYQMKSYEVASAIDWRKKVICKLWE